MDVRTSRQLKFKCMLSYVRHHRIGGTKEEGRERRMLKRFVSFHPSWFRLTARRVIFGSTMLWLRQWVVDWTERQSERKAFRVLARLRLRHTKIIVKMKFANRTYVFGLAAEYEVLCVFLAFGLSWQLGVLWQNVAFYDVVVEDFLYCKLLSRYIT